MRNTKRLVLAGLCVALGVILPIAFHAIPNGGRIFSPMHIPVLLAGLLTGPLYGLLVGFVTPLLSATLTGMPPLAILPGMTVELAIFGLVSGLFIRYFPIRGYVPAIYISLVSAMLLGRVGAGVVNALIFQLGTYSMEIWITSYFVTSFPGILVHLIAVPHVCFALKQMGVIASPREAALQLEYLK